MKKYYKAIILVLASADDILYDKFKQVYLSYINANTNIKVIFVYGNIHNNYTASDNDLVFSDIEECYYPGMLAKTLRAIKHINNKYDYDFLIRTNISTFWVFDKLLTRLNSLPKENIISGTFRVYTGDKRVHDEYISGTGIVLSKDVAAMLSNSSTILTKNLPEDYSIFRYAVINGVNIVRAVPRPVVVLEENKLIDINTLKLCILQNSHADHYRIKSSKKYRFQDPEIMHSLIKYYYEKTI